MTSDTIDPGRFRRRGRVLARRLTHQRHWVSGNDSPLAGRPGDWWVTDLDGSNGRSVTDASLREGYRQVAGDLWEKTGIVFGRRVVVRETVVTQEGDAEALPGDWVLTDSDGHSWPVSDAFFRANHDCLE